MTATWILLVALIPGTWQVNEGAEAAPDVGAPTTQPRFKRGISEIIVTIADDSFIPICDTSLVISIHEHSNRAIVFCFVS